MKSIQRQRRPSVRMELSPLIDCIFQLLIFFMLSSTFLTPAIQLTLPSATAGTSQNELEIIITLSESGDVYLNKTPTSLIALESELKRLLAKSEKKSVTIRGDENMPYSAFLDALDITKRSGAIHVNVAHQAQ
ncbi:MAG: biopolymer transporter ExbD [Pirellulales bacterium]|mgnify:FL=1|nr:biopolymer transporter ExbD [Pirellulales bacterium]